MVVCVSYGKGDMNSTHQRKTIAKIERERNSTYGNPIFSITFTDGERVKTAADAAFSYSVGNKDMREGCDVEISVNGRGTISDMSAAS